MITQEAQRINALVARHVFGISEDEVIVRQSPLCVISPGIFPIPNYYDDDAYISIVARQMRQFGFMCHIQGYINSEEWEVRFSNDNGQVLGISSDIRMSRSMCKAALRSLGVSIEVS